MKPVNERKKVIIAAIMSLLFLLSLSACDLLDDVEEYDPDNRTDISDERIMSGYTDTDTTYTLMMYMCGSDLESYYGAATRDINEMLYSELGSNVNVIVMAGGATQWQNSVIDPEKGEIYKVSEEGLQYLEDLGQVSMVSKDTLTDFISFSKNAYPADRYGLILWNHGGGTANGFGLDERFPYEESLSIGDISDSIDNADIYFDFIGFDACLMGTIETAYALSPFADYLIASEETEPGTGWYYTNFLSMLGHDPDTKVLDMAKCIIDDYMDPEYGVDWLGCTLSLIDLKEIPTTIQLFYDYLDSSGEELKNVGYSNIASARGGAKAFGEGEFEQIDIIDYVKRLDIEGGNELIEQIGKSVPYFRSNSKDDGGLAMYYPYVYPNAYEDVSYSINQMGMDDRRYKQFFDDFVSIMVTGHVSGQTISSPYDFEIDSGNSFIDNDSWNALFSSDFFNNTIIEDSYGDYEFQSLNSEELTVVERDGVYVLELTEDDWDIIDTIELAVSVDDGEGYIDLGFDNRYEINDEGSLVTEFDYYWLHMDGILVPFYFEKEGETLKNGYYSYGYIPALLNGDTDIEIMVMWEEDKEPYISGYRHVRQTLSSAANKGYIQFEKGDKVEFLFDCYTYDGDYDDQFYFEDSTWVYDGGDIEVYYDELADYDAYCYYCITDIYRNVYYTEIIDYYDE